MSTRASKKADEQNSRLTKAMSFVGSLFSSVVSSSEDESEIWDGNPDHQPTRNPVSIPIRNDVDANALGARAAAPDKAMSSSAQLHNQIPMNSARKLEGNISNLSLTTNSSPQNAPANSEDVNFGSTTSTNPASKVIQDLVTTQLPDHGAVNSALLVGNENQTSSPPPSSPLSTPQSVFEDASQSPVSRSVTGAGAQPQPFRFDQETSSAATTKRGRQTITKANRNFPDFHPQQRTFGKDDNQDAGQRLDRTHTIFADTHELPGSSDMHDAPSQTHVVHAGAKHVQRETPATSTSPPFQRHLPDTTTSQELFGPDASAKPTPYWGGAPHLAPCPGHRSICPQRQGVSACASCKTCLKLCMSHCHSPPDAPEDEQPFHEPMFRSSEFPVTNPFPISPITRLPDSSKAGQQPQAPQVVRPHSVSHQAAQSVAAGKFRHFPGAVPDDFYAQDAHRATIHGDDGTEAYKFDLLYTVGNVEQLLHSIREGTEMQLCSIFEAILDSQSYDVNLDSCVIVDSRIFAACDITRKREVLSAMAADVLDDLESAECIINEEILALKMRTAQLERVSPSSPFRPSRSSPSPHSSHASPLHGSSPRVSPAPVFDGQGRSSPDATFGQNRTSPDATFFERRGGTPDLHFNNKKRAEQVAQHAQATIHSSRTSFRPRPIPNAYHSTLNTTTANDAVYRRWVPTAKLVLTSVGVFDAITRPNNTDPEVCKHCVTCLLLMISTECIVDFEDHIDSFDAISLWEAIRASITMSTTADLDTMKTTVYTVTLPVAGSLRKRFHSMFDTIAMQLRAIGDLDSGWDVDGGMLRRRIITQIPKIMDAYIPGVQQYIRLVDLRQYLENSAADMDAIQQTRRGDTAMQNPGVAPTTGTMKPCLLHGECPAGTTGCAALQTHSPTAACPLKGHSQHKLAECKKLKNAGFECARIAAAASGSRSSDPTCWQCGKEGHVKRECPELKRSTASGNVVVDHDDATHVAPTTTPASPEAPVAPVAAASPVAAPIVDAHVVDGNAQILQVGNRRYQRLPNTMFNAVAIPLAMIGIVTLADTALASRETPSRDVTFAAGTASHFVQSTHDGETVLIDPAHQQSDIWNHTDQPTSSTRFDSKMAWEDTTYTTVCMLSADRFRQAARCLDSGCSHHLFSEQYVQDNPSKFQNATSTETAGMPTLIGNWQGTAVPIQRFVWYTDTWPTDRGPRSIRLGPCLVQKDASMNLLSEELVIKQLNVTAIFRPNGHGKYLEFDDGARMYLNHHQHLQYVPDAHDSPALANATPTRAPDSTPIAPEDRDIAWRYKATFLKDRHTRRDPDGSEVAPTEALIRSCRLAFDADLADKVTEEHSSWVSTGWRKFSAIFGFRDKKKLAKVARAAKINVTARDRLYCEAGLEGRARLKPDAPSTAHTDLNVGDKISQDPVPLPSTGHNGSKYVFFTADHSTGKVDVHATEDKSSASAIEAILEYIRSSVAYRRLHIMMPKVFKSDSEAIYFSDYFLTWLRSWRTGSQASSPYHHRQNGFIESKIGSIWGSAVAMLHNASEFANLTNGRHKEEFFSDALQHAALIDSFLPPSDRNDLCPYTKDTGEEPPFYLLKDFWGAPVMVAMGKEQRKSKVSIRARHGFFLGISKYHWRSFRIYIPSTDKIIVSQDVYFSSSMPRSDWLPVLDDDDNATELFTLESMDTTDGPSLHKSHRSPALVGLDDDDDTTSSDAPITPPQYSSPFTVGQKVVVDYGNGSFWDGIVERVTKKTVKINFPDDNGSVATLQSRHFHLIQPRKATTALATIHCEFDGGGTFRLLTSDVHYNNPPPLRQDTSVSHVPSADTVRWVLSKSATTQQETQDGDVFEFERPAQSQLAEAFCGATIQQETQDGDVFETERPAQFQLPVFSAAKLATANMVSSGFRLAMTAVLTIPAAFEVWTTAMINTVEPHLQWGSDKYLYGDITIPELVIPEEIMPYSRSQEHHVARHGPIRTSLPSFRAHEAVGYQYHEDDDYFKCMINNAPVMYSIRDLHKMSAGPVKDAHLAALEKEINGLQSKGVFEHGTPDQNATILNTIAFGIEKLNGKAKWRVVADGARQPEHTYTNTSTPIIQEISLNIFFHLVAALDLELFHLDYEQAFLSAPIDNDNIWIRLPKIMGGHVVRLLKSIYGLCQSGWLFCTMVMDTLTEFGMKQCVKDPCFFKLESDLPAMLYDINGDLITTYDHPEASKCIAMFDDDKKLIGFQRVKPDGSPMMHIILIVQYVDDLAVAYTRGNKQVEELVSFIRAKKDQVFTQQEFKLFLNFNITRDRDAKTITANQRLHSDKLIEAVLGVTGDAVTKINVPKTPMPPGWMPEIRGKDDPKDDFMTQELVSDFRSQLMMLNWITRTIPQLKYPVGQLCRTMGNPTKSNTEDLKRLVRWLAGNRNRGLVFGRGDLTCNAYSDSDWAADRSTRRSCTGYVVNIGESLVLAKSKLQSLTAQSSMEAEVIAMVECGKTVAFVRDLLNELGFRQPEPTRVWVDNQSAISMSRSQMQVYRNRHIPIRYFVCKDWIKKQIIDVQWIASNDNTADLFTKCVTVDLFDKHQDSVSIWTV